ncbi:MAG: hypothetical protein IJ535_09055 [Pseudobutyrivibrio sp.]|uniref:hypothetical protein n=1 Tax=Pseudobutyrivibrio sp. TaxID=2014367 RepID=UPI0025E01562|nr:hypothetical protein [Pseudobutyrivibrio sp.]MBQ8489915.1 hypothetical protein [Pseudobutyrivibrio sp.]
MLTIDERYEIFKNTLCKCSSKLLNKNNEEFKYLLFEDLAVEINSFLHDTALDTFIEEGYIDESIYNKCIELRDLYLNEEENYMSLSDVNKIRESTKFNKMIKLADEILTMLYV